jgi:cytosine/adenosine deaminase-related metal-dependent hydrolase
MIGARVGPVAIRNVLLGWGHRHSRELAVVSTASAFLVAAVGAVARAPFARGILLKGTVVTMDSRFRVIRHASVLVRGQTIVAVWAGGRAPSGIHVGRAVTVAPRGALIFPGLINLHDHPSWSVLPPWPPPSSDAQPAFGRPTGREPYDNRYQWNGANSFDDSPPEEIRLIAAPHAVLTSGLGLTAEATKWAEIRELLGGATSEQGAGADPATDDILARDVDNANFGHDRVETNTFPGPDPALVARERAGDVDAYIVHLAEGVPDQDRLPGDHYSSRAEFRQLQADHLLNDETVIIHGTALQPSDFAAMRAARSPRSNGTGDGLGAKLVWSPLSNLLLYGRTTNVYQALAAGITVSLGTDWSPSGSGNLLEELKIADIVLHDRSLLGHFRHLVPWLGTERALDRELVAMVTRNPALTLRWTRYVGSVAVGKYADLTVITRPAGPPRRRPASVYRSLIDATDRDVRLTLVGGDPLAGDVAIMRSLNGGDAETVRSSRLGFTKAIDVTKPGVPDGDETFAEIRRKLRTALNALGGADGYAYLLSHVFGGALAHLSARQFRADYLVPTFGTTAGGRLNAEAIGLSPILPEDDQFRFDVIEGRRNHAGAIADREPPFAPYRVNVNQDRSGNGDPFQHFESTWYAGSVFRHRHAG